MPNAELRPLAPIESLPGIGPRTAAAFRHLGLETAADLVRHLPMRYEDERSEETIASLAAACQGGATGVASVRAEVAAVRSIPGRAARVEATLEDETGRLRAVWFNAAWMRQRIHPGQRGLVQGSPRLRGGYLEMANPTWAPFHPDDPPAPREERLRPIYPASEELQSGQIERAVAAVLPALLPLMEDPLPPEYRASRGLVPLADAYEGMHAPRDRDQQREARRRLAFEELLVLQLGVAMKRRQIRDGIRAPALPLSPALDARIRARIPFALTDEQNRVVAEIAADMGQPSPMNRLLQGDVGSGKTAVALYGMLLAAAHGRQAALVAPTEILAEQHFEGIARHLAGSDVRVELLTGSIGTSDRRAALDRLRTGESALAIGTHALLLEDAQFSGLALAVIDEQHRFGVEQRARVREKVAHDTGEAPHVLVMTATPIPRTLSLTVFGDLDTSVLRGSPPGRQPVTTRVVPSSKSADVYAYFRTRLDAGEQCYVVVPAVEESALGLKDAEGHAAALRAGPCAGLHVGVVHGQMHRDDREAAMRLFREGVTQVLVATVVIEVGVDVPNASLMVVEHAERFGLAQLHQLRGRVGRGTRRSLCVFIGDPATDDAARRLEAIGSTTDGFAIAEADLAIRGPGELFGSRQSGLPPFRVADLAHDGALLALARRDAQEWIERDPQLSEPGHARIRRKLMTLYGQALGLSVVA